MHTKRKITNDESSSSCQSKKLLAASGDAQEDDEEEELEREQKARRERVAVLRRRMMKHHEIMRQVKLERDARDEERRRQEHERLLVTTSVAEQPFLFLADELVLLIFSSLSARELCLVSRVCKRFSSVAKEDKLWEALCQKKWGTLKEKDIFNRDNKVSWKVTFKNNWHKEVTKAKRLARIPNPIPCRYCGETTASTESRQRNVQYLQWIECVSCGERWGWSMETGDLRGLLSP